mgnify:CR=1 FL=1
MFVRVSKLSSKLYNTDKDIDDIIGQIAAVKDQHEINSLQTAIEITDQVFTEIIPELKVGAIEKQIAAKISYLFKINKFRDL